MDAGERRRKREATWSSRVFRGIDALDEMNRDAFAEWQRMSPLDRLALTWSLSVEQYGDADEPVERRLPRSAYRVERLVVDDLITNKRAAGRPQDVADVQALERAKKK